ncbi:hypothetical protein ACFL5L_06890 [candidate division KSB1 bacterium]
MKELGKYILISTLYLGLMLAVAFDAVGQPALENFRYNFTGEKTRFVFDLSGPAEYEVKEDWIDRSIEITLNGIHYDDVQKYSNDRWKNYIIEKADLSTFEDGVRLRIHTKTDFSIKYRLLPNGNLLYFDIFPCLQEPDEETMLQRASEYELRKGGINLS